jgi:desulfoferrodoxin (superoxide reductase-like protein)
MNEMSSVIARKVMLATVCLMVVSTTAFFVGIAAANIPTVLQIQNISQGSAGRIRLQITHAGPSSTHYVDIIEVDIGGQTKQFSQQPQSSDPFTVELDLGQIQGNPNIRARAHCNLHGWSDWSTYAVTGTNTTTAAPSQGIPGFPLESIMMGLIVGLGALILIGRHARKQQSS